MKSHEFRAEIINPKGKFATVRLIDDLDFDLLNENAHGGRYFVYLEPLIKDTTTDDQRKHWFALINDISDYTGEDSWKIILKMKYLYMMTYDTKKEPSLARNKMKRDDVTKLLQLVIDYCLSNDIPLNNNYSDYFTERQFFAMLMKRKCFVCGRKGDIAHVEAVGMGRDRKQIDHTKHHFMCLCRKHHNEQHQLGIETFMRERKLIGIKLQQKQLQELGVR